MISQPFPIGGREMTKDKKDLYLNYNDKQYAHIRYEPTGEYERQSFARAKSGYRDVPIMKQVEVDFEEVKNLRLDAMSPNIPLGKQSDFTLLANYLIDFWGAILGDSAISAYMHLLRHCYGEDKDYCYPDIELIAMKMGKKRKAVKEYFETLEEYGFIAIFHRKDILNSNSDVSPLFKVRRYVPILTKELYEQLPDRLKESHDEIMEELAGITFANEIPKTKEIISGAIEKGQVFNLQEIEEKTKKAMEDGVSTSIILSKVDDKSRMINTKFHEYIAEQVSKPSYETWFSGAILVYESDELTFIAKDEYSAERIKKKYKSTIEEWAYNEGFTVNRFEITLAQSYITKLAI